MRITLLLLTCFVCFHSSHSFFYGTGVSFPATASLASTLNKCSTTADIITQKICQINKKLLKFVHPNYQTLSNFMTDIQYIFQSTKEFYTYFLNCLSDQNTATTAEGSIRNLRVLVYQLTNYVITGFANNFANSAPAFGAAFGANYQTSVAQLAVLLRNQFTAVAVSLEQLVQSFAAIASSGSAISTTSLNATLNSDPFKALLSSLENACTAQTSFSNSLDSIWSIVSTLETILVQVDVSQVGTGDLISQAQFYLDMANQAAKKTFADRIASYMYTIDVSMHQFVALASKLFVGDTDVIAYRQVLETYVGSLRLFLDNTNNAFALMLTNNMGALVTTTTALKQLVGQLGVVVKVNLENMIASAGASAGPCFQSNIPFVVGIIRDLGFNSSQCVSAQTTVASQTASLLSFIVEDVVIEALGVIDRMCSCAVAGDPTTVRRSKVCMQKITDDLVVPGTGVLAQETIYLQTEFARVQQILAGALGQLNSCIQTAMSNFGASYSVFSNKFQVCMVG